MININQLRSFYLCAVHESFTKAAESIQVTQPSLSQQIKHLEDEVGFPLFLRTGRKLGLTPKGRILYRKSKVIFDHMENIERFIIQPEEKHSTIRLFVSPEIERPFLSKITTDLISSTVMKTKILINNLSLHNAKKQRIDTEEALFLTHHEVDGLHLIEKFNFPIKLISNKQNIEITKNDQNRLEQLIQSLGQDLVLPTKGHHLRTIIEEASDLTFQDHSIIMESEVMACLTEAVRKGIGCALLPVHYVYEEIKKSRLSVYGPKNGFGEYRLYLYSNQSNSSESSRNLNRIIKQFTMERRG